MDTQKTSIAAQLISLDGETDPETIARIQFYYALRTEAGDFSYNYVKATRCNEFYADRIASNSFFKAEFGDSSWICPDISTIDVYHNPFLFSSGKNFVMVVNECELAI